MEIWKEIKGYEGRYEVSNTGLVKSIKKNNVRKLLTFHINKFGYVRQQIGTRRVDLKKYYMQVLVATAFIPNDDPLKNQVNHKDGNKLNNNDWNLEWNTCSENNLHAFRTGLNKPRKGKDNSKSVPVLQFDLNGVFLKEWEAIKQIQTALGYDRKAIGNCCRNKPRYKTAYGFIWKFKNGATEDS